MTAWRRRRKERQIQEEPGTERVEGRRGTMEWEVEYIKLQLHSLNMGNC